MFSIWCYIVSNHQFVVGQGSRASLVQCLTGSWSTKLDLPSFEGAKKRLATAADRRQEHHDRRLKITPLQEGQLVYVRDHRIRGRQKIQDLWKSKVHQVLKVPKPEGVVYTIAPVEALDKVKYVQRTMLKPRLGPEAQDRSPIPVAERSVVPQEEDLLDNEL